jgi:hypothetical protein
MILHKSSEFQDISDPAFEMVSQIPNPLLSTPTSLTQVQLPADTLRVAIGSDLAGHPPLLERLLKALHFWLAVLLTPTATCNKSVLLMTGTTLLSYPASSLAFLCASSLALSCPSNKVRSAFFPPKSPWTWGSTLYAFSTSSLFSITSFCWYIKLINAYSALSCIMNLNPAPSPSLSCSSGPSTRRLSLKDNYFG